MFCYTKQEVTILWIEGMWILQGFILFTNAKPSLLQELKTILNSKDCILRQQINPKELCVIKQSGCRDYYSLKSYPEKLRRIKFYDAQQQKTFVFITNNFALPALDIAMLYKYRWKVELFFKWIKQHLKIKSFWGTTINAVKTQVYIAIITYTLVSIIKSKLKINRSTYEILQILSVSLFDKTQLNQLLQSPISQDVKELKYKQLEINLI